MSSGLNRVQPRSANSLVPVPEINVIDLYTQDAEMVAELAVGMARRLRTILAYEMNEAGYFHHSFQGPFDQACYVLWELDVARADPGNGSSGLAWPGDKNVPARAFSFFSDTEMRTRIIEQTPLRQDLVVRVLAAFVGIACDYGDVGTALSPGREPFIPQTEYARQIDVLAASGYIERRGELVEWTGKIVAAMQARRYWDASGVPPLPRVLRLSNEARQEVAHLLQQEQRLAAINIIRSDTGATILEAKQLLSEIERLGPASATVH